MKKFIALLFVSIFALTGFSQVEQKNIRTKAGYINKAVDSDFTKIASNGNTKIKLKSRQLYDSKMDTTVYFLTLSQTTTGGSVQLEKGDSVRFYLSDTTTVTLPVHWASKVNKRKQGFGVTLNGVNELGVNRFTQNYLMRVRQNQVVQFATTEILKIELVGLNDAKEMNVKNAYHDYLMDFYEDVNEVTPIPFLASYFN